jgi:hypothetical protein
MAGFLDFIAKTKAKGRGYAYGSRGGQRKYETKYTASGVMQLYHYNTLIADSRGRIYGGYSVSDQTAIRKFFSQLGINKYVSRVGGTLHLVK